MILGSAIVYFYVVKNYNPIRELLQIIGSKMGVAYKNKSNELGFIKNTISETLDRQEKINEKLAAQDYIIKENFLTRLVKGKILNETSIEHTLTSYNMHFNSENFVAVIIYIEDINTTLNENDNYEELIKHSKSKIKNIAGKIINKNYDGFVLEFDEIIVCIINVKKEHEDDTARKMIHLFTKAKKIIEDSYGLSISVAISLIHKNYNGIAEAYEQALETIEYKTIIGSGQVMHFRDINIQKSADTHDEFINYEMQLLNCVHSREMRSAKRVLNIIFEEYLLENDISIYLAKCRMAALINTFHSIIVKFKNESVFADISDPMNELYHCDTVNKLRNYTYKILKNIESYIESKENYEVENTIKEIKQFVNKRYIDSNLSVAQIADVFDMNISYLSKLYKRQTGEVLSAYIHKIRLDNAKKLIVQTDLNIAEVSKKVGYYNSNALIRSFNKYIGITPGKYKEQVKY